MTLPIKHELFNNTKQWVSVPKPGYEHTAYRIETLMTFEVVKRKSLKTVCGYNYTISFADWMAGVERLVGI